VDHLFVEPADDLAQRFGFDLVPHLVLAVGGGYAELGECVARLAPEVDRDH